MARVGMILAAALMLAAGGTVEVLRSGSRVDAATLRRVQDRLAATPQDVGDWTGRDLRYDQKMLDRAEARAHLARRFTHAATGESIDVLVLAGNPQAIGAHDPTVCFAGSGFKQEGAEQRRSVQPDPAGPADGFWAARFSTAVPPATIELLWAWGTNGRWTASENPRFDFATEPLLLKIYVSRQVGPGRAGGANPTDEFLKAFLPKLREAVNPAAP